MKVLFYSARSYDKISFREVLAKYKENLDLEITFTESSLNVQTAKMAVGYDAVCIFVNDDALDIDVIYTLYLAGVKTIALRCAGYNNVNLERARSVGIKVIRVPGYSPESIAEHAMTLATAVNRHIHKAYTRVRDNNFSLTGLSGFCLHGKTAGIVGYGKIGKCLGNITKGYGMKTIAYDPYFSKNGENDTVESVDLKTLFKEADFIFLTTVLNDSTYHMINQESIKLMKNNVVLVNVSRGALIDTEALIAANKEGKFFGIGLDVYEGEDDNVYTNHEDDILMNCITSRLLSFPNVIVTSHQAFLTDVALEQIAIATCAHLNQIAAGDETIDPSCIVQ